MNKESIINEETRKIFYLDSHMRHMERFFEFRSLVFAIYRDRLRDLEERIIQLEIEQKKKQIISSLINLNTNISDRCHLNQTPTHIIKETEI